MLAGDRFFLGTTGGSPFWVADCVPGGPWLMFAPILGLVCVPWVGGPLCFWLAGPRGEVGERWGIENFLCIAIPFDESDSQVKVN